MSESAKRFVLGQLERTGVVLNGANPWDPQVHNERLWARLLRDGTLVHAGPAAALRDDRALRTALLGA